MPVTNVMVERHAATPLKCLSFPITSAISQTDLKVGSALPGFRFMVDHVEVFNTARTAVISANVKIETTSVLASAVTLDTGVAQNATLSTTLANRRGKSTDRVNVHYTSDGAGAVVNGVVRVWIRPFPLSEEVIPG